MSRAQMGSGQGGGLDIFRGFMAFPRDLNTGSGLGVCDSAAGVGVAVLAGKEPVWEVLGWGEKSSGGIKLHTLEPVK